MKPDWNITLAKDRMASLKLTYADIARYLGYERQTVGHWFRGTGQPSVRDLKKMAAFLGVQPSELINDDAVIANSDVERETVRTMRELTSQEAEMVRVFAMTLRAKRSGK